MSSLLRPWACAGYQLPCLTFHDLTCAHFWISLETSSEIDSILHLQPQSNVTCNTLPPVHQPHHVFHQTSRRWCATIVAMQWPVEDTCHTRGPYPVLQHFNYEFAVVSAPCKFDFRSMLHPHEFLDDTTVIIIIITAAEHPPLVPSQQPRLFVAHDTCCCRRRQRRHCRRSGCYR
jgi:hypothetical protein